MKRDAARGVKKAARRSRRSSALVGRYAQGRQVVGSGKNRRLEAPDGRFYTEADITKTGMDYAAFLIARLR